jgi:hypothetical protein
MLRLARLTPPPSREDGSTQQNGCLHPAERMVAPSREDDCIVQFFVPLWSRIYHKVADRRSLHNTVWDFHEGHACVELKDKYGFIDRTGKEVIPLKYDYAEAFNEETKGLAKVKLGDREFYIDTTGKYVKDV